MSPQLEHPTIVTVSSIALVASVDVVDVVKTGQLGTVRTPQRSTEERTGREDEIITEICTGKKDNDSQGNRGDQGLRWQRPIQIEYSPRLKVPKNPRLPSLIQVERLDYSTVLWQGLDCTSLTPPALPLQSHILSFFRTFDIGIPRTNRSKGNPETIAYAKPLFNIMPALAERFYRVLHNLSIYRHMPDFMMRYLHLHLRESFFTRQLAALPFIIPHVEVQYSDGSRVAVGMAASSPSLPSFGCGPTSSTLSHWTFTRSLFATTSRASQSYSDLWKQTSRDIPHVEVQYSDGSRVAASMAALSPSLPSFSCGPTSSTLLHWTFTRGHLKGRLKSYYLD
ncbi:hypothetical protein EDB89DRAFT_2243357 [Lactarius sanguifluus]|nr:hypothetical protein EDB89DRAFT_2243357 [Lactarius sanguifluus]